jgi:cell division protein FtsB
MIAFSDIRRRSAPLAVPVLSLGALLYFGYHLLEGERGLKAWWTVNHRLDIARFEHKSLRNERDRIEARVAMLREGTLDRDLLEEQLRRMLNYARPGEAIIIHPEPLGGAESAE